MIASLRPRAAALWLCAYSLSCKSAPEAAHSSQDQAAQPTAGRKVVFYKSPMDPSFISKKPGKDSMGMELVPVYEGDPAADLDTIEVKGATVQTMGLRIAPVKRMKLTRLVRALGRIEFDETRVSTVNMKFDGWIEKLYVNETGQLVEQGESLFAVYSPELLASQREYLQVLQGTAAGPHTAHIIRSARERLRQFDVPEAFVERLERKQAPQRRVVIRAPSRGYVVHKKAFEGTFVKKGANLFTLADLDALWVMADVFEFDAPWVYEGQEATVELDYLPGHIQKATVDYVYPTLNEKSRTLQVRLVLPNPEVALKPGMFATVRIHTQPAGETLVVPSEAVIHSGERNVAFVSRGNGLFEPRDLTLGAMGDEGYQVLSGLSEHEPVVTSGHFLLDSESRLKEAVKKLLGSNIGGDQSVPDAGTPDAGAEAPAPSHADEAHAP